MDKTSEQEREKEFLAAYDEFGDAIFRFLSMKIADRETARDLTQETFTRAWDFCVEGGEIREWRPFLYRTAYNLVVDVYRKKKSVSLDALLEDDGFAMTDNSVGERSTVEQAEVSRVRKAIDKLDLTYRDIILLRFTEDLPPKEIARITGLSENVVSVRIHRGVEKLRTLLGPSAT
ncbi:sigma-70 family RNA polymerase sigma factor [Candidatus Kaiserbacteria bacterium]|nr:sigma-70 family RNA polymerase sigma factor [Candidatus Kaiserbacteria bacterium]